MSGFDINQLTISGNLTSDPDLRHTTNDTALCKIRIAHNERRKLQTGEWVDNPQFFDATIWAPSANGSPNTSPRATASSSPAACAGANGKPTPAEHRQAVDITADSIVPTPHATTTDSTAAVGAPDDDIPF